MKKLSLGFITLIAGVCLALSFVCPAKAAVINTPRLALSARSNSGPTLKQASTNLVLLAYNYGRDDEDPFRSSRDNQCMSRKKPPHHKHHRHHEHHEHHKHHKPPKPMHHEPPHGTPNPPPSHR